MLSVVIPTYNEEDYVSKLLQSLCEQTYKDFEVIVVDGQSEDNTISAAKIFSDKLKLRIIMSPERGVAYQRNLGAASANGDLLLFLDADILLKNYFLERALNEIAERQLDIAGCYLRPLEAKAGRFSVPRILDIVIWQVFFNSVLCAAQYAYPCSPGGGTFSKKWLHKRLGGYDCSVKLAEDHDYSRRAAKIAKFRLLRRAIFVSMRREELEGRIKILVKFIFATLHKFFLGEIRSDVFKYRFGHYKKRD